MDGARMRFSSESCCERGETSSSKRGLILEEQPGVISRKSSISICGNRRDPRRFYGARLCAGRTFQMTLLHRPGCKEVAKTSFSGSRELSSTKLLFPSTRGTRLSYSILPPDLGRSPSAACRPAGRTAKSQWFCAWPCAANRDGLASLGCE